MLKNRMILLLVLGILLAGLMSGCDGDEEVVGAEAGEAVENDDGEDTEESENGGASENRVTAEGYGGEVVIDVLMDGNTIEDILLVEHNETPNLGDNAMDSMIEKILDAQSVNVDVETGATISSMAIINGVAQVTGEEIAAAEAGNSAEYDLESYEAEGVLVSGKGFQDRYDIYLDVIFDGNEIIDIRVIEHNETMGFGDGALSAVPQRIINQQCTEVDIQTGATWTSVAIMEIVEDAVQQAGVTLEEREVAEEDEEPEEEPSEGGG